VALRTLGTTRLLLGYFNGVLHAGGGADITATIFARAATMVFQYHSYLHTGNALQFKNQFHIIVYTPLLPVAQHA
jgi:hypothetical protein